MIQKHSKFNLIVLAKMADIHPMLAIRHIQNPGFQLFF